MHLLQKRYIAISQVGAKFENTLGTNVTSVGAVTFDSPGQSDAFRSKKNGFLIDEKVENNDTKKDGPKFKENKDVLDKVWTLNNRPNIVNTLYKPCARHYYVCGITPWLPWSKFIPVFLDLFSLKWHFLLGSFFEINRSHTMKEIGFEIVSGKVARGSKLLLTEALLGIRNRLGIVIGVPAALAVLMYFFGPPFSQLENTIAEAVRNIKTFFKTTFELPHLFEWLAVRGFVILSLGCKWLEEDFLYCVENAGPGESTDTRKECSGDVRSKFKAYSRLAMKAYDEPSLGMTANATVKTHQYSYNFFHSYKDGRVWCWIREPQSDELHVAVVVRGTYDIVDMLNNWKLAWGSEASTKSVLKLYYSALKECCEELWESRRKRKIRITFCGHSLGASVAEALHCNIKSEELKKSIHPTLDVQSIGAVTFDSPGLSKQFRSEVKHGFVEIDVVATKENTENSMKPTSACDVIWTLNYQPNVMNLLYPPSTKFFFCCGVEHNIYPPNVFNFFPFIFHEVSVLYKGLGGRMKDILNEVSFDNKIRLVQQEPRAGHFARLCAILRGLDLFYNPFGSPVVSLIIDCVHRPCWRILCIDAALCICIPFLNSILADLYPSADRSNEVTTTSTTTTTTTNNNNNLPFGGVMHDSVHLPCS